MSRTSRRLCRAAVVVSLAVAAGCSGDPKVVTVTGTVTRGGKPVPNLFLNFMPEQGRPSWGITDDQGRYKLNYDRHQDGAEVGTHTVWVGYQPRDITEDMALREGKAKKPAGIDDIVKKYGDQTTTPLKVQISKNNRVVDLQLD